MLTWRQARIYADNETLFRPTVERNPTCFMAHNNLALALLKARTQQQGAIRHLQRAVDLKPDEVASRNNLGFQLASHGQIDEAPLPSTRPCWRSTATTLRPTSAWAICWPSGASWTRPSPTTRRALGLAAAAAKSVGSAGNFRAKATLRAGCGQRGGAQRPWPAVVSPRAIRRGRGPLPRGPGLQPDYADPYFTLGLVFFSQDRRAEAVAQWREGLRLAAPVAEHVESAGRLLATDADAAIRNGREAVDLAQRAAQLTQRRDPQTLDTLAAAYAEAGRFAAAVQTAQEALSLPAAVGDAEFTADLRGLKLYQAGSAFHQPPSPAATAN